jgi:hypothetical protein
MMGWRAPAHIAVPALLAATLAVGAVPRPLCRGTEGPVALTYVTDGSAAAAAIVEACAMAEGVLADHGWTVPQGVVRVGPNPFDATAAPAEISLSTREAPEDTAFELTEMLVRRTLAASRRAAPVDALARTVAEHIAVPSSDRLAAIEREWLTRVGRGDVVTTALPELLWRVGADEAIRSAASGRWPDAAIQVLRDHGCEDPVKDVGEIVLAALVQPQSLGLTAPPLAHAKLPAAVRDTEIAFSSPAARYLVLPTGSGAIGIQPLRTGDGAAAWLAVRYALTGECDVVRLGEGRELAVPLQGLEWAAVVVVSLAPSASVSLNLRVLGDFPQHLARWDFVAAAGTANLAWETDSHRGLSAYVVEALRQSADGTWSVARRVIIPVADDGGESFGYAFVDPDSDDVAAYRLLALTEDGLLGEVSSFPVPGE